MDRLGQGHGRLGRRGEGMEPPAHPAGIAVPPRCHLEIEREREAVAGKDFDVEGRGANVKRSLT